MKSTYRSEKWKLGCSFSAVLWEGFVSDCSHDPPRISNDQLPGMVSPMFIAVLMHI